MATAADDWKWHVWEYTQAKGPDGNPVTVKKWLGSVLNEHVGIDYCKRMKQRDPGRDLRVNNIGPPRPVRIRQADRVPDAIKVSQAPKPVAPPRVAVKPMPPVIAPPKRVPTPVETKAEKALKAQAAQRLDKHRDDELADLAEGKNN